MERVHIEGNKGGSYLIIDNYRHRDESIVLEVGHECVVRFSGRIKVEKLAEILSNHFDNLPKEVKS